MKYGDRKTENIANGVAISTVNSKVEASTPELLTPVDSIHLDHSVMEAASCITAEYSFASLELLFSIQKVTSAWATPERKDYIVQILSAVSF